ncbi:MAG: hypothetical protein Q8P12_02850 [bacterium]|nr:hypothetical protein [bacterium]
MRFVTPALPILVLSTLLIGGAFLLQGPAEGGRAEEDNAPRGDAGLDPAKEREHWTGLIDTKGAAAAYEDFKETFADSHFSLQHLNAHLFGELLYRKLGIEGIAVCDATFAFGCYHSFFGQALAEHGMAAVEQLDRACIDKFGEYGTGCQHGIGHGLLEYFGHRQLIAALEGCTFTTQVQKLFGCTSGVFMEYNVPIIITPEFARTEVRELDGEGPYAPCATIVPEGFRESCYYEMAQWWDKVYLGDYAKIGELCQGIALLKEQEPCYLGTGNVAAPSSDYDVASTIEKCEAMPTSEGEFLCRAGASWSFFAVPERRELAPLLCEGLGQDAYRCAQKSDLIGTGEITR